MKTVGIRRAAPFLFLIIVAIVTAARIGYAQFEWQATVGAQSQNLGRQALAFLPNEIWIHAGDKVTWRFDVDEIHTVTFLTNAQPRPPFPVGCPGFSSNPAVFTGANCVTTPPLTKPQAFTIQFPTPGNFRLVCLVHPDMTGVVHVLNQIAPLPHEQPFYDAQAKEQAVALLSEADRDSEHSHPDHVIAAGTGQVLANAGGASTAALMRFSAGVMTVHAGQTVEWDTADPATPHTITFGVEPANPMPPSANVTTDPDGARHATLNAPGDSAHSGFIAAPPQERIGLPQAPAPPPGATRFRVTFTHPGVYPYICALHDDLGMKGTIIVVP
jgi:plastocyanin